MSVKVYKRGEKMWIAKENHTNIDYEVKHGWSWGGTALRIKCWHGEVIVTYTSMDNLIDALIEDKECREKLSRRVNNYREPNNSWVEHIDS